MKELKAEVIAVGTELLLGQISNTNAQWLSERLAEQGISVYFHGVVGDNLARVEKTFELAQGRSDMVFVTGGLGPTDDDLTREAFQQISGLKIKEDPTSMEKIAAYFNKSNRMMTPNNRKQARVFENSKVLNNTVGMAPGILVSHHGVTWFFMPGVPKEMKQITKEHIFPYLKEKFNLDTVIRSRMLNFIGIGESQLEHQLKSLIESQRNPTIAPLAKEGEVAIRLTANAESNEKADAIIQATEDKILEVTGSYFYGYDEVTIEEKVAQLLKDRRKTIAAAESFTGGGFTEKLVSMKGASQVCRGSVVSYAPFVKENILRVSSDTIATFGTVSEQCATEMAKNVSELTESDIGISFTGEAGPESAEDKPVGTVYIGIAAKGAEPTVHKFEFSGGRNVIRSRSVKKGFELLYHFLK